MNWFKDTLNIKTQGKGLYPFTSIVEAHLKQWDIQEGMCIPVYAPYQRLPGDQRELRPHRKIRPGGSDGASGPRKASLVPPHPGRR